MFTSAGLTGTFLLIVYIKELIPYILPPDLVIMRGAIWQGDLDSY